MLQEIFFNHREYQYLDLQLPLVYNSNQKIKIKQLFKNFLIHLTIKTQLAMELNSLIIIQEQPVYSQEIKWRNHLITLLFHKLLHNQKELNGQMIHLACLFTKQSTNILSNKRISTIKDGLTQLSFTEKINKTKF